jgi:hypothetical protein
MTTPTVRAKQHCKAKVGEKRLQGGGEEAEEGCTIQTALEVQPHSTQRAGRAPRGVSPPPSRATEAAEAARRVRGQGRQLKRSAIEDDRLPEDGDVLASLPLES